MTPVASRSSVEIADEFGAARSSRRRREVLLVRRVRVEASHLADEGADRLAGLHGPPHRSPCQNGILPRLAGCG